jgi:hypothetical protein
MKQKPVIACLFLIYIMTLPVFSYGSGEQERPNAAVPDSSHEFEPVLDGAQIIHDFVVLNTGNAILGIEKVETG